MRGASYDICDQRAQSKLGASPGHSSSSGSCGGSKSKGQFDSAVQLPTMDV